MSTDDLTARRAARIEDLEFMAATGETVPGAAARLRIRPDTLRAFLRQHGRRDLLAQLLANQDDRPYPGRHAAIPHTPRRWAA